VPPRREVQNDDSTFAQLLEFAPDAIIGVDRDGRIVLANQQAATLFGYDRNELFDQTIEMLVPEHARSGHPDLRRRYLADPRTRPMGDGLDLAARRSDGTEFPAEISLSSLDAGGVRLVLVAVRDVSERRAAAHAQARLAAIVEASGDAIVGHDRDGTITSWNPAAAALYGYSAEEAIGQSIAKLEWGDVAGDLGPPAIVEIEEDESTHLRKDGARIDVVRTVVSLRGQGAEDLGMATIIRDVTEQRAAERKFEGLLDFAPDAIIGVLQSGRISLANRQAEAMFGYPRGELVGVHIDELVPRRVHGRHADHRASYHADPATRPMGAGRELAGRRRDGSEFPAEISLSSLDTEEGPIAVAAIRDLTDRAASEREHALQEELNQARRLESVGQLAGGIAHDFNNLLGVILNLSDLVIKELPDGSTPRADVQEISLAAQRAAALTRQLLIFSRRDVVQAEVLDLAELVRGLEGLLRRAMGERVDVHVEPGGVRPWPVCADRGQLEQVLVNLAVNARDAMPDGGTLTIALRNVELDGESAERLPGLASGGYVQLTVRDTGTGMEPEVLARAFEPFFTTKREDNGTGLGLATVYGIVAGAGGRVAIESRVGAGTAVVIHLPATDLPIAGRATDQPVDAHGGTERILVVEDEAAMREVAARILRGSGYDVRTAGDATEALAITDAEPIDLVLTDVIMPGMVGPDLAARLLEAHPELKIVFMSGYSHKVLGSEALTDAGRTGFVEKPFTALQLREVIRTVLDAGPPEPEND
jgi:PAS domain S-box-containing protein